MREAGRFLGRANLLGFTVEVDSAVCLNLWTGLSAGSLLLNAPTSSPDSLDLSSSWFRHDDWSNRWLTGTKAFAKI